MLQKCVDPGSPTNGGQNEDHEYPVSDGTEVSFYCDTGYALYDTDTETCLDEVVSTCIDGEWTEPVPTCQPTCEDPGQPENGGQVEEYEYPVCSPSSTCEDGQWTTPPPECQIMCTNPGSPDNGGQVGDPTYPTSDGDTVVYYCDAGYDLFHPDGGSCLEYYDTTCQDGNWTDPVPECKAECDDPGTPSDGSQVGDPQYPVCSGTDVAFVCSDNHELHGEEILTCEDGEWNHPIPSCNPTCEDPGAPKNGHQIGDHDYPVSDGTVVEFGCDDGYVLFDMETLECMQYSNITCENGSWSDDLPRCKQPCDDPGTLENGRQKDNYEYPVCTGTVVEYECNVGYELNGTDSTQCRDGEWSNDMPVCEPMCADPGSPTMVVKMKIMNTQYLMELKYHSIVILVMPFMTLIPKHVLMK
ncbi:CUB and sushi domain-containing protein 3-like [Saccoglossus kowalevskii]